MGSTPTLVLAGPEQPINARGMCDILDALLETHGQKVGGFRSLQPPMTVPERAQR